MSSHPIKGSVERSEQPAILCPECHGFGGDDENDVCDNCEGFGEIEDPKFSEENKQFTNYKRKHHEGTLLPKRNRIRPRRPWRRGMAYRLSVLWSPKLRTNPTTRTRQNRQRVGGGTMNGLAHFALGIVAALLLYAIFSLFK